MGANLILYMECPSDFVALIPDNGLNALTGEHPNAHVSAAGTFKAWKAPALHPVLDFYPLRLPLPPVSQRNRNTKPFSLIENQSLGKRRTVPDEHCPTVCGGNRHLGYLRVRAGFLGFSGIGGCAGVNSR